MARFVWRDGNFVDPHTGAPMQVKHDGICTPYVLSDLPAYASPITGAMIDGRSARREDLKKHNCVEMDPPSKPKGVRSEKIAREHNLPLIGRDCD